MSLRRKIIILFVSLALLPLLILAGVSYWQAQDLLMHTLQAQAQREVLELGEALEENKRDLTEEVAQLARSLGTSYPDSLELGTMGDFFLRGRNIGRAAYVQVDGTPNPPKLLRGSVPLTRAQCADGMATGLMEVSHDFTQGDADFTLTAGFWISDLIGRRVAGASPLVLVLAPEEGVVLFSTNCELFPAGALISSTPELRRITGADEVYGSFRFETDGRFELGGFARLKDSDLTVVALTSPTDVVASLNQMAIAYWVFVLGLGVTTSFAFSVLIGRFTRTLSELSRAAEEIGTGELDPWLPLPSTGELGQLTSAFTRMLAKLRQMMSQVDQNGRLAVVGQLSAYLAHEIRNPLSSIKMNLQRLKKWTEKGALPAYCLEPLEISLREVDRLNASVSDVLQLSQTQDSPKEVVSLHSLVEEVADLLRPRFRRQGVALSLDLDATTDRVFIRAGQVKGLILNLMVNALEAQPGGGYLKIRSDLSRNPESEGPVVSLHFKDNGPGVPAEIRERIFEPFFTTKSGGSGIGLAMAHQAIRDNDGRLFLEPRFWTPSGSEFVASFPLAALVPERMEREREINSGLATQTSGMAAGPVADRRWSAGNPKYPTNMTIPDGRRAIVALSKSDAGEEAN